MLFLFDCLIIKSGSTINKVDRELLWLYMFLSKRLFVSADARQMLPIPYLFRVGYTHMFDLVRT